MKLCKFTAAFLAMLTLLPVPVKAAGVIEPKRKVELTIENRWEETSLPGVEFRIYQISTVDEGGELTVLPDFSRFSQLLDIRGENASRWELAAREVEQYILTEALPPEDLAVTNEKGTTKFPAAENTLAQGLYLVMGTHHSRDGWIFSTDPFFVQLPSRENNQWIYSVTAHAKAVQQEGIMSVLVTKEWVTDSREELTLPEITVRLFRDGEEYDAVTLPQQGRWYYRWDNLAAGHSWWIREDLVEGYRGELEKNGSWFLLRNISLTGDSGGDKLPQTGQLWWPVPVLMAAGLLLILLERILRERTKGEG